MIKKYDSIDLLKFIASFFVIMIHVSLFADLNIYLKILFVDGLARLAVPLYFLASAFFFYKKDKGLSIDDQKSKILKYVKRMSLLYLGWFLISLPKTIYERLFYNGNSIFVNLMQFIKSFFLTSTFSGSWFLLSCVFSVVFVFLITKKFKDNATKVLIIIASLFYLLCVAFSAYGKIFDILGLTSFYDNFIFFVAKPYTSIIVGVPYFLLGRHISHNESVISKKGKIFLVLSILLFILEIIFVKKYNLYKTTDCYLMLLPVSYFFFIWVKDKNIEFKFNSTILRNASTIIFFSHFIWIFFIEIAESFLKISVNSILRFIIVSSLSLLTVGVFLILGKHKRFSWLKLLY